MLWQVLPQGKSDTAGIIPAVFVYHGGVAMPAA
jgi:hypothetical protein